MEQAEYYGTWPALAELSDAAVSGKSRVCLERERCRKKRNHIECMYIASCAVQNTTEVDEE